MLENLVRKVLSMVGINDATDEQLITFIRKWKLEKLPAHYIFMTRSIFPVIEMVMKKLSEETIDWSEIDFNEKELEKF